MTHNEQECKAADGCHFAGGLLAIAAGAALGATLMYFADPSRGKIRHADLGQRTARDLTP